MSFNPYPKPEKKEVKKVYTLRRSPLKKKFRKPTGELALFYEIWLERAHYCEECIKYLPEFSHYLFHHKQTKGAHPELRLIKTNIKILCFNCHNAQHQ